MRLNKFLAHAGICSRRKADELIKQGRVKVNSKVVQTLGIKIDPNKDKVEVDDKVVVLTNSYIYLVLNKPVEVITSLRDPQGRKTIMDFIPSSIKSKGVVPVGRLDYMSEGLVLLTNDKELVHKLTHPRHHVPKSYIVKVKGSITEKKLKIIREGMVLNDGTVLAPVKVDVLNSNKKIHTFKMTLFQGINRQIRRMCKDLDLVVLKLLRISIGPIKLKNLKPGKYRILSDDEVKELLRINTKGNLQ